MYVILQKKNDGNQDTKQSTYLSTRPHFLWVYQLNPMWVINKLFECSPKIPSKFITPVNS